MDAHEIAVTPGFGGAMIVRMRAWIPPLPLALGVFSLALSWIFVLCYAITPSFGIELTWIHLVALGGFTTISLAVLVHVIPTFTDLAWRGEGIARRIVILVPLAAFGLAASFALQSGAGVAVCAVIVGLAIAIYLTAALVTLSHRPATRTEAAIARAFAIVLLMLGFTALFGVALGIAYARGAQALLRIAPAHAVLGIAGWLTMLAMGVSARTFRPILGTTSRVPLLHIVSNTAVLTATVLAVLGLLLFQPLFIAACVVGLIGACIYAAESADRIVRATTPQRAVHAFAGAAMLWLVVSAVAALLGDGESAVIAALAGWIGSMVLAHLHHIGVRVLATLILGDGDETRPWLLLRPALTWITFILGQTAVLALLLGTYYVCPIAIAYAGFSGLAALASFAGNLTTAAVRARHLRS